MWKKYFYISQSISAMFINILYNFPLQPKELDSGEYKFSIKTPGGEGSGSARVDLKGLHQLSFFYVRLYDQIFTGPRGST